MPISGGGNLVNNSVTTPKIANGAVTMQKLDAATSNVLAELDIIAIFAAATAGLTVSQAQVEVFSTAAGKFSTINTGATTATFSSGNKNYAVTFADSVNSTSGYTFPSNTIGDVGDYWAILVETSSAASVVSISKMATTNFGSAKIYLVGATTPLASASFTGNTATFSSPVQLAASRSYYLVGVTSVGGSLDYDSENDTTSQGLTWTGGYVAIGGVLPFVSNGAVPGITGAVIAMTPVTTACIVTNALAALNGSYELSRFYPLGLVLPSGATATYDIDLLGTGAWTITGQPFSTWNDLGSVQTYTNAKIRINFNQGTAALGTTASMAGYQIMED